MIGWIVIGLFVIGGTIMWFGRPKDGAGGEERMSAAFVSLFGMILVGLATLIVAGAGIWNLF